jgi:SAM-dependent methyltransferase
MSKNYTLSRRGVDKNSLYQWSVQDADHDVEWAVEQYEMRRGRPPLILREDFCGTALVASRWVQDHPERQAIGLDIDAATLDWARQHNLAPLGKNGDRVDLRECDVRTITEPKADVVQAFNFSYYLLHPLPELFEYFRMVRKSLAPGGIFLLDSYGGLENQKPQKERRTVKSPAGTFGFVWEHEDFNPIDNRARCHIHFEFNKGKRWKRAFSYDFRLYSLAEIRDALTVAGFTNIQVIWDFEEDEDADCDYRPASRVENSPGWIAYVVADAEAGNGTPPKIEKGGV